MAVASSRADGARSVLTALGIALCNAPAAAAASSWAQAVRCILAALGVAFRGARAKRVVHSKHLRTRIPLATLALAALTFALAIRTPPTLAAEQAPATLASDWMAALQAGRDARHFPRPAAAQLAPAQLARPPVSAEAQLLQALDRGDRAAFAAAWRRLQARHALQQAQLDQVDAQLARLAVGIDFQQRQARARAESQSRWRALEQAVLPLLSPNAKRGDLTDLPLRRLLAGRAPVEQPVLGFDPLPLRHLQATALPLGGPPLFTPQYLLGEGNCANFDDQEIAGPEAAISPQILAKAAELGFEYTRIHDFVRTQIQTEWYPGSQRGALGTLLAARGNDVDQSSLLIALLRASGIRAAYVHGLVEVPVGVLRDSMDDTSLVDVDLLLHRALRAHEPVSTPPFPEPTAYRMEYTWVVARLSWEDYRGSAAQQQHGLTCVPMDAALKRHEASHDSLLDRMGLEVEAFEQGFLAAPQSLAPLTQILAQADAYLAAQGQSLDQWLVGRRVSEPAQGLIPPTLPFATIGATAVSEQLPGALRATVHVRVSAADTPDTLVELTMAEVLAGRLTLSFLPATWADQDLISALGGMSDTPAYLIRFRPELSLNGRAIALGAPLTPGEIVRLSLSMDIAGQQVEVSQQLLAGGYAAIVLTQSGAVPTLEGAALDGEPDAARLLANLGRRYFDDWNADAETLALLAAETVVQPLPSVALVINQLDVQRVDGLPVRIELDSVGLDVALRTATPLTPYPQRASDLLRLVALQGSALEALVFDLQWATPAISADRLLGEAAAQSIPVLDLQGSSGSAQLPGLLHPESVRQAIGDWLQRGYRVRLPNSEMQIGAWRGSGWLVSDDNGSSGYFLSGGLAGGITLLPPEEWYLADLAQALADPYGRPPNHDPLSGAFVKLDASAQDQQAQHDSELATPLRVKVEDASGRAVVGAQVRFELSVGHGALLVDGDEASVLTVPTDLHGVAQVRLRLGQSSPLVTHLHLQDETYPQEVRYYQIDVTVPTNVAGEVIAPGEPYRAYGLPGPPVQLGLTAVPPRPPGDELYPPGIGHLGYRVIVVDQLGYAVSNVPFRVSTSWEPGIQISNPGVCSLDPMTGALPAGVFLPGECPSNQLILTGHACVGTSRDLVSRHFDSAFSLVPPNVVGANVRADISSAGLPTLTVGFSTSGTVVVIPESGVCRVAHGPWQSLFGHSVHDVIGGAGVAHELIFTGSGANAAGVPLASLHSFEAAPPGELLPLPRTMYFAQRPAYADLLNLGGLVASWDSIGPSMLPDDIFEPAIPAAQSDITLSFDQGASIEELRQIAAGTWQYQLRVPSTPARTQGELEVRFPPTPEQPQPPVIRAQLPEAWAVQPTVAVTPQPLPLTSASTTASELRIELEIDPPDYQGTHAQLQLLRNNEVIRETGYRYAYDGFYAQFGRGLLVYREQSYSAAAIINQGTPFELASAPMAVPLASDVIIGVGAASRSLDDGDLLGLALGNRRNLTLKRSFDVPNERVCEVGAELVYYLAQPADVTLRLRPIDEHGTVGPVVATPLNNVPREAGLNRLPLSPTDVPFGTFRYELIADGQLGNSETETGILSNEPARHDHLALGHTIVRGVDVFDGQFVVARSDAQAAGRGPALAFRRSYSSAGGDRAGVFGRGWSSTIESHLRFDDCNLVQVVGGEGAGGNFVYDHDDDDGNAVYRPLDGYHSTLLRRPSGDWDLFALDGTRYQYDGALHRLRSIADSSGNQLSLEYGQLARQRVVTALVQDSGRRFELRYEVGPAGDDGALPLLRQLTGPGGIDVRYSYDEHGLLTEVRRAGQGSADPVEQYGYHDYGRYPDRHDPNRSHRLGWRLIEVRNAVSGATINHAYAPHWSAVERGDGSFAEIPSLFVTSLTETDAGTVQFAYSGERGRPVSQLTSVTNARNVVTSYTMNQFGGVELITDPIGTQSTDWDLVHRKPASQTDAEGVTTEFTYDEHGNTTLQRITGNGGTAQASWSFHPPESFDPPYIKNRAAAYTDYRGVPQTYAYDSAGRLSSQTQGGVSMSYGYNERGDQIRQTDYNGNSTVMAYNAHGLPIRMTYADGSVGTMAFDERGREIRRSDELGRSTTTEYDGLDRPLLIDPPGPGTRRMVYDDATPALTEFDELDRQTTTLMDKQGRAVAITNALGDSRTMSYDEHGNVLSETDFRGNERTATFDPLDRRQTLTEPLGRVTTYSYLKTGQLREMTVTGEGGERTTRYRYQHPRYFRTGEYGLLQGEEIGYTDTLDGEGHVLTRSDALGRVVSTSYDPFGRPLVISEPEGRSTTLVYDAQGNLTSRTIAGAGGSRAESYEYDARHRQTARIDGVGERWTTGYDAVGNVTSQTDPLGRVSHFDFDERNRLITQQLPGESRITTYSYDAVDNRIGESLPSGQEITHVYDDLNRLTESSDQLGPIATFDYDPDGHVTVSSDGRGLETTTVWDALGRKQSESQPEGRDWSWTWNAWDQPLSETNPRDFSVIHSYDTLGRRTESIDPIGTQRWEFDAVGNLLAQTNRRNHTTSFDYDDLNRRIEQTDATGESQTWTLNAFDEVIAHLDRRGIETTTAFDRAGRVLAINRAGLTRQRFLYDGAGQRTSAFDPLGRETRYHHDAAGRVITESLPEGATITRSWTPADDLESQTDPDRLVTGYEYDERRRLISESNSLGETTTHGYDGNGNRTSTTRPLDQVWTYDFDEANRLVAVTNPESERTDYEYDEQGNRSAIVDANQHRREFEFDALDRMTEMRYPGGASETTSRDPEGNPTLTTRPDGQRIERDFDARNRLIRQRFNPVAEDGVQEVVLQWNGNDAITQVSETLSGTTCAGGGSVCTASFVYDDFDRLIEASDRNGLSLTQRYDAADNRLARGGPEGETAYVYNGLDQLTALTPPGGQPIGLAPTPAGRWGQITHGNGVRTEVEHDGAGRMSAVRHWLGAAAVLLSSYSFDANGNRISETIQAQGQSWQTTYTYDAADRLTGYTAPEGTTSYELDAVGNRIQTTAGGQTTTADFDDRDRLTHVRNAGGQPITTYQYDEAGRQISQTDHSTGTTTHYSYSATDRLIAIRQASPSAEPLVRYEYHRLTRGSANGGQRSARIDAGTREHYQWDGLKLAVRTNALGNPLARYSHANGWTLVSAEQGAEYHYHVDALGTPLVLTDEAGAIAVRYRLDPWGVVLEQTQPHVNPIGFTGYLRDTATDQLYAQARQYLPGVGRFGSVDPWEGDPLRPVTLNQYLYGNANPLIWLDPDGFAAAPECAAQGNCPEIWGLSPQLPGPTDDVTSVGYTPMPSPEPMATSDVGPPVERNTARGFALTAQQARLRAYEAQENVRATNDRVGNVIGTFVPGFKEENELGVLQAVNPFNGQWISVSERETAIVDGLTAGGVGLEVQLLRRGARSAVSRVVESTGTASPARIVGAPRSYNPPYRALTKKESKQIRARIDARSMSRDEYARIQWNKRFNRARREAVENFWAEERQRLARGEAGTRNWSQEQREQILSGATPTTDGVPLEGHHMYSARAYPQFARDSSNIYPATRPEHVNRWHGGSTRNPTHGQPLDQSYPEEF